MRAKQALGIGGRSKQMRCFHQASQFRGGDQRHIGRPAPADNHHFLIIDTLSSTVAKSSRKRL
jgi:hypothetical protein